ncbi:MAG: response regulator [Cyclobacteriaceae bacterium]|nr:response regulator [Cyclobacteriaceae bacterium]
MNQLSILLIEDDPDDVELLQEALKNANIQYNLHVLGEGNTVLPYLEVCKNFPNIILLDLNIPKLHGREVLKLLKSSDKFKGIPVAVLTTASSQTERDLCIELGADQFLTKPATVDGFTKTVKLIVDVAAASS